VQHPGLEDTEARVSRMIRHATDGGLAAGGSDSNTSRDVHALKNPTETVTQHIEVNTAWLRPHVHQTQGAVT